MISRSLKDAFLLILISIIVFKAALVYSTKNDTLKSDNNVSKFL
jgi:hypothetical protein